ncbi:M10 family metallopeptidase C-terminal domain-containing protein [Pseudovibrio sp. Tun.PSC04-5.I4]|uniref:M10 family metallopeptidase C-terminal domain-containing protein n=1 Tax=Pseudovibrio sp. Tun.PSC04-5.I4 TaxID=1798213 RepID=UPI000882C7BE|nr:M10 family metallopeptidase C-terminal domain-containing protein [Pseudovibrio sp. Tun.PSC04-5.I4]SDR10522.1 epralysin. Metallo peptidase. MEROPS family M10B [Pseudovibrio sp. Tun.PSC04-5.I4]
MTNLYETRDASDDASTSYRLTDTGVDAQGTTHTVFETVQGTISNDGDSDWYAVELTAGQTYTFAAMGTFDGENRLVDPYLRLRDGEGNLIVEDDDGGPGSHSTITFTAATSGTVYLDVASYDNVGTGQYGLSVVEGDKAYYDGNMGAGALIRPGLSWSGPGTAATVTYGFRDNTNGQEDTFAQVTDAQITAIEGVLASYSEVANISFDRVEPDGYTDDATLLFSNYNSTTDGAGAYAFYPGSTDADADEGDVWLNTNSVSTEDLPTGSYSHFAVMHEIGHAIGLAHPGDYNAGPGVRITYDDHAQFRQDTQQYSVMSYFDESNADSNLGFGGFPDTLMPLDVLALQQLYGVNMQTRADDTTYGYNSNAGGVYDFSESMPSALTIWDAGGNDTIDMSGAGKVNQMISLVDGTFSNVGGGLSNLAIAYNAIIENAIGSGGNDTIIGNAASNTLVGKAGNDTLIGAGGSDKLIGGNGHDTLRGGSASDLLKGGAGDDTLDGGSGDDKLIAGSGDDTLTGGSGSDNFCFFKLGGDDTITDFEDGSDIISIKSHMAEFDNLTIFDDGDNAIITFGTNSISLMNVNAALLTESDFAFV